MEHDAGLSMFLFPNMPMKDRRLVLQLGEFLSCTTDLYRDHLATELRLLQDAALAKGLITGSLHVRRCRVLPFRRFS